MFCSQHRIIFHVTQGANAGQDFFLCDFDTRLESEPILSPQQGNAASTAIFFPFGSNYALGGTVSSLTWASIREFTNTADAFAQILLDHNYFPWGQQGDIYYTIKNGATWKYERSVIEGFNGTPYGTASGTRVTTSFSAKLGKATYDGGPLPAGTAAFWELVDRNWEDIDTNWEDVDVLPVL